MAGKHQDSHDCVAPAVPYLEILRKGRSRAIPPSRRSAMRLWQKIALLIPLAALVAPSGAGVSQASQDERLSIASLAGDGAVRLNGGDAYSVPEAAMSGVVKIVQSDARLYALKETGQLLVWT